MTFAMVDGAVLFLLCATVVMFILLTCEIYYFVIRVLESKNGHIWKNSNKTEEKAILAEGEQMNISVYEYLRSNVLYT